MATNFKSIEAAERRIRQLKMQLADAVALLDRYHRERIALAKLAAKGPAFYNLLDVYDAEAVRDEILRHHCRMKPDGSPC